MKRLIRVSPDTLYRDLHGEGILLQLETGQYFGLGKVAHRIWQLILEHRELSLVEVTLLSEYPVDPATLSRDLDRFVDQLVEKKLVEIEILPV
ncbi:MAG: PqqD family protein [Acidobacteria bacterium]|nr:PqqD family protein [Acidobacteriota bacterium]